MIAGTLRLARFETLLALGTWRWLAVVPALFLAGYLGADRSKYDPYAETSLLLNWWDGPLSMMVDSSMVVFTFGFGFAFVVGDLYVRDRSSGTAALTMIRSQSRARWWAAKVLAIGALALVYSALSFGSALAASALQLPLSLGASATARAAWGSADSLYPRIEVLPVPVFFFVVGLYTALALWAVGALVLGASVLYPRPVVPLAVTLLWVILGSPLGSPLYLREGLGKLDPLYHLSYVIHFGTPDFEATRWTTSIVIILASVTLALCIGAWKLRRTDII